MSCSWVLIWLRVQGACTIRSTDKIQQQDRWLGPSKEACSSHKAAASKADTWRSVIWKTISGSLFKFLSRCWCKQSPSQKPSILPLPSLPSLCHAHLGEALEERMRKAYLEPGWKFWDQLSQLSLANPIIQSYQIKTNAIHITKLAIKTFSVNLFILPTPPSCPTAPWVGWFKTLSSGSS